MKTSTLSQLLHIFQEAEGPLSVNQIARELAVPPARLAGMIDYWVRRGRIGEALVGGNCGPCAARGSCLLLIGQPRCFELIPSNGVRSAPAETSCCPESRPVPARSEAAGALRKQPARNH